MNCCDKVFAGPGPATVMYDAWSFSVLRWIEFILNSISSGPEYSDSSEAYHTGNNSSLSEAAARLELQTMVREDFTITEMAPARAISRFQTLCAKQAPKHSK